MRLFRVVICLALLLTGCTSAASSSVSLEEEISEQSEAVEEPEVIEEAKEKKFTIYLDAGHGGFDSGAVYQEIEEKEINLLIVQKLIRYLQEDYIIICSREEDVSRDLSEKAQEANEAHADVYVAVHQNIHTNLKANGIEVWYNSEEDKKLAQILEDELIQQTGANERGIWKSTTLVCLTETEMPAVLIETGFLSNQEELSRLLNEDYQDQIAYGIYLGLKEYFCEVEE